MDAPIVALSFLATVAVFGIGADRLGFYSDDAGFLTSLPGKGLVGTIEAARHYVPGRNLHVIWQQLFFLIAGHSPGDLGALHVIHSCVDATTVALFYLLLRKLRVPRFWAVVGTALFAFYPDHGETHYWLSSGPMNVMSTLFLVAFAYATAAAMEQTARTGRREERRLIAAQLVFFVLALFTYDQTFFVLLFILAIRGVQLVRRRVAVDAAIGVEAAVFLGAILLYVALKRHPESGPTLTHVSASHVWSNVQLSLRTTFGSIFQNQIDFLLQSVSIRDREIARTVAGGFVLVCAAAIGRDLLRRPPEAVGSVETVGVLRPVGLVAAGVVSFFLAYLPADIWFISPRHNFLPTAGLALAVASAGAALTALLARCTLGRFTPVGLALAITIVGAIFVARFVEAGLSEKRYWQEAYQLRRGLYANMIQRHLLAHKTAIVFQGFPSTLGPAPYFGQENHLGLRYLYPRKLSLNASSISALKSERGYYLYTEIDRYGPMPARFLPRGSVADIVYLSETPASIRFATSSRAYALSRFYRAHRLVSTAAPSTRRFRLRIATLTSRNDSATLSLSISTGTLRLAPGEELAAVLFHRDGLPWTTKNSYGEAMVLPIGLTASSHLPPTLEYDVQLRHMPSTVSRDFERVSLYVLSRNPARKLATVSLAHR